MLKIRQKLTSLLLPSSGRSRTSVESEGESTRSGAAGLEQAGEKTLPELDTRTRLIQLYAEYKTLRITFAVL